MAVLREHSGRSTGDQVTHASAPRESAISDCASGLCAPRLGYLLLDRFHAPPPELTLMRIHLRACDRDPRQRAGAASCQMISEEKRLRLSSRLLNVPRGRVSGQPS